MVVFLLVDSQWTSARSEGRGRGEGEGEEVDSTFSSQLRSKVCVHVSVIMLFAAPQGVPSPSALKTGQNFPSEKRSVCREGQPIN